MQVVSLLRECDTRRLQDPAYVADLFRDRASLTHEGRRAVNCAVEAMLVQYADLTDRDHVVTIIRDGIDDAIDHDTTTLDWAEAAYRALVKAGLIAGAV
jgi:hypothetical protein